MKVIYSLPLYGRYMSCQNKKNVVVFCHGAIMLQGALTSFQENGGDAYEKSS